MSKNITVVLLLITALSACKKDLKAPVQGYFFMQQTPNEAHVLYINEKRVGILPNTHLTPFECVDSTLDNTAAHSLTKKSNRYQLKNSNDEIVTEGLFKFSNNGFENSAKKDFGHTYISYTDNTCIMGFNTLESASSIEDPCREPPVN